MQNCYLIVYNEAFQKAYIPIIKTKSVMYHLVKKAFKFSVRNLIRSVA